MSNTVYYTVHTLEINLLQKSGSNCTVKVYSTVKLEVCLYYSTRNQVNSTNQILGKRVKSCSFALWWQIQWLEVLIGKYRLTHQYQIPNDHFVKVFLVAKVVILTVFFQTIHQKNGRCILNSRYVLLLSTDTEKGKLRKEKLAK